MDFDSFTEDQFVTFCSHAVALAKRWVVMSCAWQHAAELEKAGIPLVRLGIWHKLDAAPQFTGDRPGVGWEAIAILHRDGKKRWNDGGHHAVWVCNVEHGEHPTQKPLRLVTDWVLKFTEPGETVLDPFMGSGTTAVACAKLGCTFIGIEKRPDYFNLAVSASTTLAARQNCSPLPEPDMPDDATPFEKHYRIGDLAKTWKLGRETLRKVFSTEPGVVKIKMGRKRSHTTYSIPESVARRVHTRLLNTP